MSSRGDGPRRVTAETLGGWVIKCNPAKTDLEPMRAAGVANSSWCVAGNYRAQLMRPGHRVLFWVTGPALRGIWGAGRVVGALSNDNGQLKIPVHIPLFRGPVTATDLSLIPGLRSMEVFRSPQQANPSWVTAAEWALIETLLPR